MDHHVLRYADPLHLVPAPYRAAPAPRIPIADAVKEPREHPVEGREGQGEVRGMSRRMRIGHELMRTVVVDYVCMLDTRSPVVGAK